MKKPWAKRTLMRRKKTARAMKKRRSLADAKRDNWFPPYYYSDRGYLKRVQVGNKYWKRFSNRCVRRTDEIPTKGNGYRKAFDYWWVVY